MFSTLPVELLIEILKNLDYCTLQTTKRVCHVFNDAASTIKFHGLTPAIWATIFSKLSYFDNKLRVSATCKPFSRVIKNFNHPKLSSVLFREEADITPKINKETKIRLHPAFQRMSNECSDNIDYVGFYNWKHAEEKFVRLSDASCAYEYATSPPTTKITIQFGCAPKQTVTTRRRKNPTPITVLEVMKACCKAMGTTPNEGEKLSYLLMHGESFLEGLDDEKLDKTMSNLTYREFQGDHTGFTGFEKSEGNNDGSVYIESVYFDS